MHTPAGHLTLEPVVAEHVGLDGKPLHCLFRFITLPNYRFRFMMMLWIAFIMMFRISPTTVTFANHQLVHQL